MPKMPPRDQREAARSRTGRHQAPPPQQESGATAARTDTTEFPSAAELSKAYGQIAQLSEQLTQVQRQLLDRDKAATHHRQRADGLAKELAIAQTQLEKEARSRGSYNFVYKFQGHMYNFK